MFHLLLSPPPKIMLYLVANVNKETKQFWMWGENHMKISIFFNPSHNTFENTAQESIIEVDKKNENNLNNEITKINFETVY